MRDFENDTIYTNDNFDPEYKPKRNWVGTSIFVLLLGLLKLHLPP